MHKPILELTDAVLLAIVYEVDYDYGKEYDPAYDGETTQDEKDQLFDALRRAASKACFEIAAQKELTDEC
jgi:hypothetical protein